MNAWKFPEIATYTAILLNAYLATMHSTVITATYTYNDIVYAYDLTENDLNDLATVTGDKLQIKNLGKKRIEKILDKSVKVATINDVNEMQKNFPKANGGYIAEFVYRNKMNGETIEEIKHSNNSKGYEIASDTKDNRQLKNLDTKATFTEFTHLLDVCEKRNYNKIEDVKNAIEQLNKIYK